MNRNMFRVTSGSGKVCEYFETRKSAIDFIVDEFSMAMVFRTPTEGEKLTEYLKTNNETPNQYEYKYKIEEVYINHDYDFHNNSVYVVLVDRVEDCMQIGDVMMFQSHEEANEMFESIVLDDMKKYANIDTTENQTTIDFYDRWENDRAYATDHLCVQIMEFEKMPNGSFNKIETKCNAS